MGHGAEYFSRNVAAGVASMENSIGMICTLPSEKERGMLSDCERTMTTVYAFLGLLPESLSCTPDDLEFAFVHVRRCAVCRNTISAEERRDFLNGLALERE